MCTLLLSAARWQVMIHSLNFKLSFLRAVHIVLATWPASVIIPSRLADGLRAVMLKEEVPLKRGLGAVVTEKAIDLQSLGWILLLGCLLAGWFGTALLVGLAEVVFWVLFLVAPGSLAKARGIPPKLQRVLEAVGASAVALRDRPRLLFQLWVYSLAGWALTVVIIISLLNATGASVAAMDVILVWPATVVASILPITLTGVGTRDTAFIGLLSLLGRQVDAEPILVATLLYPVITAWFYVVIGIPFSLHTILGTRRSIPSV